MSVIAPGGGRGLVEAVADLGRVFVEAVVTGLRAEDVGPGRTASTPTAREFFRKRLLRAVRAGAPADVVAQLRRLDDAGRKACVPELKELRDRMRGGERLWTHDAQTARRALRIAGFGCLTGAAAAVGWLSSRDLRTWGRVEPDLLLDAVEHRDPVWQADVARRLAARTDADDNFVLIHGLLARSGGELPDSEALVLGWLRTVARGDWRPADSLLRKLREDPLTPRFLVRAVSVPDAAAVWALDQGDFRPWGAAIRALTDEGVVDRGELLGAAVAALVRGGRPQELRPTLALVRLLEPTPSEYREHVAAWAALVADAPSPVAGFAQERLGELALAGELDAARLADVSAAVLCRPEKKLVRGQLSMLDKALRRAHTDAGVLLPSLGTAFSHDDTALAERAVKLVVRELKHADEAAREELVSYAEVLRPELRALLAGPLGLDASAPDAGAEEDLLPAPPVAEPLGAAAVEPAEVAAEVGAVMSSMKPPVADLEQALDALVRATHRDRAAMSTALDPLLRRQWWSNDPEVMIRYAEGIGIAVWAVTGVFTPSSLTTERAHRVTSESSHATLDTVYRARLFEVAHAIVHNHRIPFLLATPQTRDGSLEPATLIARLHAYAGAGVTPLPIDFGQALLRVRVAGAAPDDITAARALGSAEGTRLAEWLVSGGLPERSLELRTGKVTYGWYQDAPELTMRCSLGESLALQQDFPPAIARLGRPYDGLASTSDWHTERMDAASAVLPHHPEVVAAWRLLSVAQCAEVDQKGAVQGLADLAAAPGLPGPVVHLAVAFGLGARQAEDRLAAVDALLVLAARQALDPTQLGADLGELIRHGAVKVTRLTDALTQAAATGVPGAVWSVLAALLPPVLAAEKPVNGLGGLLAVAADCAERCRPGGAALAGLDAYADRGGSSGLVRQARRLRTALAVTGG
ncbi:hypothetical protein SRB5_04470 [Streptomyces sp. RB5]|uniref:Secreted protein n=1 Tax=Streptomyces smaragdinus TaxID=2585196 RepID=A0A7K0CA63_9ACTN|nr:DUF6493 family protein [Streptomyces smaragdinus]MQY10340.1 hypothetical protein [Streptomyces smaragdinus]